MIHRLLLHPDDRPVFSVAVQASGYFLELAVNDVPVFRETSGASCSVSVPLNEWLFQGDNDIRFKVRPLSEKGGNVEARLEYRRMKQPLRQTIPLVELTGEKIPSSVAADPEPSTASATGQKDGQPAILSTAGQEMEFDWAGRPPQRDSSGAGIFSGAFVLPAPWPVCAWADAAAFDATQNILPALTRLVQDFWNLLNRRDAAGLMRHSTARARSLETAYHLNSTEVEESLLYPMLIKSPAWAAQPLPESEFVVELAGGGKLARLLVAGDGESPLRLTNDHENLEAIIDAWWAFTHGWVLLR